MTAVLRMEGVSRVYGAGHTSVAALREVSLEVDAGELVAIMGPSGSGKTTLLSLAGGLDQPTNGTVVVDGVPLHVADHRQLAALRRRRVGYVFQELNLLASLTASENVSLPLELDGAGVRRATMAAVEALGAVGLGHLADRFPDDLSGGEQQRVAIARALAGDRRLLLADEPTGALDSLTGESVMRLMRTKCDELGVAVVVVTHEARHAAWADRVVFLRDGVVTDQSGPLLTAERLLHEDTRP